MGFLDSTPMHAHGLVETAKKIWQDHSKIFILVWIGILAVVIVSLSYWVVPARSYDSWEHWNAGWESLIKMVSLLVGGYWVYSRFISTEEAFPKTEMGIDLVFLGIQGKAWLVDVVVNVVNKGKVPYKVKTIIYDLRVLKEGTELPHAPGQPLSLEKMHTGAFRVDGDVYYFIDPGVTSRFSQLIAIPQEATFVSVDCWFQYEERVRRHNVSRTFRVPSVDNCPLIDAGRQLPAVGVQTG